MSDTEWAATATDDELAAEVARAKVEIIHGVECQLLNHRQWQAQRALNTRNRPPFNVAAYRAATGSGGYRASDESSD